MEIDLRTEGDAIATLAYAEAIEEGKPEEMAHHTTVHVVSYAYGEPDANGQCWGGGGGFEWRLSQQEAGAELERVRNEFEGLACTIYQSVHEVPSEMLLDPDSVTSYLDELLEERESVSNMVRCGQVANEIVDDVTDPPARSNRPDQRRHRPGLQ